MQCRDGGAGKSLEVSLRWSAWVERTERRVLEAERLEDRTCWRGEGAHLQWPTSASAPSAPGWPRPASAVVLGGHYSSLGLLAWVEGSSQFRVSHVGLTLAPITLHGPLADSVVNFWLPLLAFGPEPCRPHFPSHLLLCVSLPCVACRATEVGSK